MSNFTRQSLIDFDSLNAKIFTKIRKFTEGSLEEGEVGVEYLINSLILFLTGSLDYYNNLLGQSNYFSQAKRPLTLEFIEDEIDYGYIDAALEVLEANDDVRSSIIENVSEALSLNSAKWWHIDAPPPAVPLYLSARPSFTEVAPEDIQYFQNLSIEYPEWKGWPTYDEVSVANTFPSTSGVQMPVFYCGQYFTVTNNDNSTDLVADVAVNISLPNAISESYWLDYEDIRIYRLTTYQDGIPKILNTDPSGTMVEIAREIDPANGIVTIYTDTTIAKQGGTFTYIVYWKSPDVYLNDLALPPVPGSPVVSSVTPTINIGRVFNYFFKDRKDYINYSTEVPILKALNRTNYSTNELDENVYDPYDPEFYPLAYLLSSLDEKYQALSDEFFFGESFPFGQEEPQYGLGFSANYRDTDGEYPDQGAVFGVVIGVKTYADLGQSIHHRKTLYEFNRGPDIFPDMFPDKWENFEYYPGSSEDYVPYVKLIVEQKRPGYRSGDSPRAIVIHLEYTEEYATRGVNNLDLVTAFSEELSTLNNVMKSSKPSVAAANFLFSSYIRLLAYQINEILINHSAYQVDESHNKYSNSGDYGKKDSYSSVKEGLSVTINNLLYSSDTTDVRSKDIITSDETGSTDVSLQPWFKNVYYWKNPSDFGISHLDFSPDTNWIVAKSRQMDMSRIYARYSPGVSASDHDTSLPDYDPDIPTTTKQRLEDTNQTGLSLTGNTIENVSDLEIYFPPPDDYSDDSNANSINQDYTIRLTLIDDGRNRIVKEFFIPNANYFVSDYDYEQRQTDGLTVDGYLSPSIILESKVYQEYGDAVLIPNCSNGQAYRIWMRVFDPDDPTLKTYDEWLTELTAGNEDLLNSGTDAGRVLWEDIIDQLNVIGETEGFDTVDLRTISNHVRGIEKMWLGLSTYTMGTRYWRFNYGFVGGEIDLVDSELALKTRWGYKVNGSWRYQNFTKQTVIDDRTDYSQTHINIPYIVKDSKNHAVLRDDDFSLNGENIFLAQTFTSDFLVSHLFNKVDLWIERVGNATIETVLRIYNLTDNRPAGLAIAESNGIAFNEIPDDGGGWVSFEFIEPIPFDQTSPKKYGMVLTTIENPVGTLDSSNKLRWYFANQNEYAYGFSGILTYLSESVSEGDTSIVVDDVSIFPAAPFFINIDGDLYYVISVDSSTNTLYLSSYEYDGDYYIDGEDYQDYYWHVHPVSSSYSSGLPVTFVSFIPYDPENRFYIERLNTNGTNLSQWLLPWESNLDASYRIYADPDSIGIVEQVPFEEWFGTDLEEDYDAYADSFYIVNSSAAYDSSETWLNANGQNLTGTVGTYSYGLRDDAPIIGTILGGFNVTGVGDFPSPNTSRVGVSSKVDGFWSWNTDRLVEQDKISILPQAKIDSEGTITYLPFYRNMFVTMGLVRSDGSRKVVNKILYGFNHDAGIVEEIVVDNQFKLRSTILNNAAYVDYWPAVETLQWVGKTIKFLDGNASGTTGYITANTDSVTGDTIYTVTLLEDLSVLPSVGDPYVIPFTSTDAVDSGDLEFVSYDSSTITVFDNDKTWTDNQLAGYVIWFTSGNLMGEMITIDGNTNNTISFTLQPAVPGVGDTYVVIDTNSDIAGAYCTDVSDPDNLDSNLIMDNEEYIGIDHVYIDANAFPSDYWGGLGYTDAFLIRGTFDVTR